MSHKLDRFRFPASLRGKSFLDVGCWEGHNCVEAVRRGARRVVGIDLCTSEDLAANLAATPFEFVQMDIFSETFLALDGFDFVLCSGVLYHVPNVLSLLNRLRAVTRELLVLETPTNALGGTDPVLQFYPANVGTGFPSRWWTPNRTCLFAMLDASGFKNVNVVWEKPHNEGLTRTAIHATPVERASYSKLLPRREQFMSVRGGQR